MLLGHRILFSKGLVYFLLAISFFTHMPEQAAAEETMTLRAAVAEALRNNHEMAAAKHSLASHKED
ncbi:MAG: hypothetical protein JRD19_01950, partial [Deltaproteobacteria bacterium]|nr:hypothetical protein [Deltaproteobacteria bacterium]